MNKDSKMETKKVKGETDGLGPIDEEKFARWMKQKFYEEGADIIHNLKEDPQVDQMEDSEELFHKISVFAKAKGLLKPSPPKDDDTRFKKKRGIIRFPNSKGFVKCAAVLAVTLIGVCGIPMTGQANRENVMREVEHLFGRDMETKINNTSDVKVEDSQEKKDRKEIEKKLDLNLPIFSYLPQNMKYLSYEIDESAKSAYLKYMYNDNVVYLMVMSNYKDATAVIKNDRGELLEEVAGKSENIVAELWDVQEEGDVQPTLLLQWEQKNTYYKMAGKIEKEELINIIEKTLY